ncbi:MAG: gamma-glutamyltransferase [Immundisolibacterales bacterium]|nr:gamma-glutamyltransferase [Immundisolibacterales bacterium]
MRPKLRETWEVRKPLVRSAGGVVSSQHYLASEAGARVLAEGGNAVDAAVTAGLALGTVEPWMSGLGGCGQMIVRLAREPRAWSVDFGLVASRSLDPADYPLEEGRGSDLFHWPAVEGDRNVMGPLSIAVPTYAAGVAAALERFGTRSWAECLAPAIELAERGLDADWYATLKIASTAAHLARDEEARRVFLPGGFPPCSEWSGPPPRLRLGKLAQTLRRLGEAGPRDFYEGAIARSLVADARRLGARIEPEDLAGVEVRIRESLAVGYAGATVRAAPGLTGGPSLERTLGLLSERRAAAAHAWPGSESDLAVAYADALSTAYAERLAAAGHDAEAAMPACTTHLSVVDRDGNLVALTQTLLSLFGSRVMFPGTGVLMNNGVMWFDPRPGRPNSIAAGRRPMSNMCPVVVERSGGERFALGASGGRRIMPAVMQLVSFLTDLGLDLEAAFHAPRIDASGADFVTVDPRFAPEVAAALGERHVVEVWPNAVYPAMYACPNAAGALPDGDRVGAAYVMSPWALAAPVEPK